MGSLETRVHERFSRDIVAVFKVPSVCLVLLSGLPGAGKSTLCQALCHYLSPSDAPEIVSVVELDDFIQCSGDGSFCPEAWRAACVTAREATEQKLRNWSNSPSATMRFVLLIDTLPYRSMRTVYWRICRGICQERLSDPTKAVGMLEVRLNTPLGTCLRRNENRTGTAAYVPPYVIKSMATVFDSNLPAPVRMLESNSWTLSSGDPASTWPVLVLCKANEEDECFHLSAHELARQLIDCLLSVEVLAELSEQVCAITNKEAKRRECVEQQEKQKQKRLSILHGLDIHMRALVRNYMADRQAAGTMSLTIGPQVSAWREEYYVNAKRAVQLHCAVGDEEAADACVQEAIKDFEHKLASSWVS